MVRNVPEDAKRTAPAQVLLSPEELERLDTWRFGQRIGSRSEAIRQILRLGLAADAAGYTEEDGGLKKKPKKGA